MRSPATLRAQDGFAGDFVATDGLYPGSKRWVQPVSINSREMTSGRTDREHNYRLAASRIIWVANEVFKREIQFPDYEVGHRGPA